MSKTSDQDPIAAAMTREAIEQTPAFSSALHAKIMRLVESAATARTLEPRRSDLSRSLMKLVGAGGFVAGGIAATFVLAATLWFSNPAGTKHSNPILARVPSIPVIRNPVATLAEPVGNTLADARFAYLDRDARNVIHYMAEQVDVLPASR